MQKWLYHQVSVNSSLINQIFAFRLVKITKTGCGNMDQDVAVREEDLLFTLEGGIGRIIFNRPQARNAFTFAMYERLAEICERANSDRSIKVLLLRGARVKDLIYTARLVEAEEAASVGLLTEIVDDLVALEKRADEVARLVAGNAPLTLSATKQAVARLQKRLTRDEGEDLILMCYQSQ